MSIIVCMTLVNGLLLFAHEGIINSSKWLGFLLSFVSVVKEYCLYVFFL